MAEFEGKNLVCDLCGRSVFLKYIGEGESDGGFTKWRKYEEKPKGWSSMSCVRFIFPNVCPSCAERIEDAIESVVNEIRKESQDG